MSWFTESSMMLFILGAVAILGFAIAIVRTGRVVFAGPIVGILVLLGVLFFVERAIVTDREQVYDTVMDAATAVRTNDVPKIQSYISKDAKDMHSDVEMALDDFEITQLKVTHVEPKLNTAASPPTAKVEFIAILSAHEKSGGYSANQQPVRFYGELKKEEGGWKFTGYAHDAGEYSGNLQMPRRDED